MKQKIYEPVREFERQTSYCPLYLAWRIVDEVRDYFRTSWVPSRKKHLIRQLPESFKIGLELPETPNPVAAVYDHRPRSKFKPRRSQSTATTAARFVHGCELLVT